MDASQTLDSSPRRALQWGGGLLVLGLATVGVGAADEGSAIALMGLLITIYGIHTFGRLGSEEPGEPPADRRARAEAARSAAVSAMWLGGLAALAGAAIGLGGYLSGDASIGRYWVAYGALFFGVARVVQGWTALGAAERAQAKVAARRGLSKHPRP